MVMAIECGVWVRMGTEGLRARQEHSPPDLGWFCFDSLKKKKSSQIWQYEVLLISLFSLPATKWPSRPGHLLPLLTLNGICLCRHIDCIC